MSLKSRIEALILQISNAKTSLRSALSNKGVSVSINPSWDEIAQGINNIEFPVCPPMPEVSLSFGGIYSAYLEGNKFSTTGYTVYYNGRNHFGGVRDIQFIVDWMNADLVNKVIVWCVASSQADSGTPVSYLALSELGQGTNWSEQIKAVTWTDWRGGIMRLSKATAAAAGTKLTFQGNHVLISYNN